jgi:hypothetical protein
MRKSLFHSRRMASSVVAFATVIPFSASSIHSFAPASKVNGDADDKSNS